MHILTNGNVALEAMGGEQGKFLSRSNGKTALVTGNNSIREQWRKF